jgi:hypothetical protein
MAEVKVEVVRVPEGGIQPQGATDSTGVVHLVYFKGEAAGGDLFYVRMASGQSDFSSPVRVNSVAGSAVAMGSIRGAQVAMGRNGRVHVAWNPSAKSGLKGMQYARLKDAGDGFEEQKTIAMEHAGLDGGGSVAADEGGNVYVVWHAPTSAGGREVDRRVWVARSIDDGQTFASDTPASVDGTGACGCCSLRAYADRAGTVFILYRAAREMVHRDTYLLSSSDHGATFKSTMIAPMHMNGCIMSSYAMVRGPRDAMAAWETAGQVSFGRLDPATWELGETFGIPGAGKRKYPALAQVGDGAVLVAWGEGTSWNRGGEVGWQVFDASGRVVEGQAGRAPSHSCS